MSRDNGYPVRLCLVIYNIAMWVLGVRVMVTVNANLVS